jgi:S1-C subfamily serine protease
MRAVRRFVLLAGLVLALPAAAEPVREVPQSAAEITLSFAPVVRRAAPAVVNIYATRVVRAGKAPSPATRSSSAVLPRIRPAAVPARSRTRSARA